MVKLFPSCHLMFINFCCSLIFNVLELGECKRTCNTPNPKPSSEQGYEALPDISDNLWIFYNYYNIHSIIEELWPYNGLSKPNTSIKVEWNGTCSSIQRFFYFFYFYKIFDSISSYFLHKTPCKFKPKIN